MASKQPPRSGLTLKFIAQTYICYHVCLADIIHRAPVTREPTCALFILKIEPSKVCSTDPGDPKPVFNWLKEEIKQQSQNVVRE